MFRVTNRMKYNDTLINAFRQNQGMLQDQEQLATGKRINKPSDDPTGMAEVLQYRTLIGKDDQYSRVMESANSFLNTSDSTIGGVHDMLTSIKSLALQQANGTASAGTRQTVAISVDNAINQLIQYGNTRVGSRYIFSGQSSSSVAIDQNGNYVGSSKNMQAEINVGQVIPISVRASDFLAADMSPSLSGSTQLSSLNHGSGVPAGSFTITNRAGASATITITPSMTTMDSVINAINSSPLNVKASVSSDGYSLTLTDNNATPTSALTITDGGSGTAQALGISGSRNLSVFTGNDANPSVTGATKLSDLYNGAGLPLSPVTIVNGGSSATVTFNNATTVQDLLNSFNAAGGPLNISVGIDSTGRRLTINSTNPNTVAYAKDASNGHTADMLGVGGGRNAIPILQMLSKSLKANDVGGILGAIDLLGSTMDNANSVRGVVGSRANQVTNTQTAVDQSKYDYTTLKSQVEDADFIKVSSDLAMLQTAYQATLKASSSIVQPSLMDFLR